MLYNSKKIKSTGSIFTEIDNSKYFFASNFANSNNSEGVNEVSTCVIISKDFKILFGFTPGLVSKYGERSYFKTNKDLETFLDK
ncbi:MAG: hypothetical protein BWY74_03137 [Firmicutes bacterium ADurb.Bin419]|nr:MAG: hypothetical protein BWY74_03137 [Firmicutes bacterium ADurb.Bin419]